MFPIVAEESLHRRDGGGEEGVERLGDPGLEAAGQGQAAPSIKRAISNDETVETRSSLSSLASRSRAFGPRSARQQGVGRQRSDRVGDGLKRRERIKEKMFGSLHVGFRSHAEVLQIFSFQQRQDNRALVRTRESCRDGKSDFRE